MALEPGSVLHHRYRIESTLGTGGMGAVYKAFDINLGVPVAVKENLFTTAEYNKQFHREATILASLRHPNLPRVTDHFVIEGQGQYLVMDFIEGEDLRQRLERTGAVPEAEALPWVLEICEALTYLHTRTPPILHRDIKPGNIKITPEGRAILVDFGLAKRGLITSDTETGAKAMTPGFSPPEQYGTGRTDVRTDVFSLGATIYAVLTAAVPEDSLERAMRRAQLTPLRERAPGITPGTARAVEKALATGQEERYQSIEEFVAALSAGAGANRPTLVRNYPYLERTMATARPQSVAGTRSHPVRITRRRPSRWPIYLFGGAAALTILAGAASTMPDLKGVLADLLAGGGAPEVSTEEPVPPTATESQPTPTTGFSLLLPTPILNGPSPSPLDVTSVPTLVPTPMQTPTGGGSGLIAFASDREGIPQIFLINLDGTGLTRLTNVVDGACQPDFSPDGRQIVFTAPCPGNQERYPGSSLWVVNVDGSGLRALPTVPLGGDFDPAWSPDGRRIAFTSLRDGRAQIYAMNLDGTELANLSGGTQAWDSQPDWSPTGLEIVFTSLRADISTLWIMSSTGESPRPYSRSGDFENSYPEWSADGSLILFAQNRGGVSRLAAIHYGEDRYFEAPICLSGRLTTYPMAGPAFSLDGNWIAFETWPTGVAHDIAVISTSCTNYAELTSDAALDFDPTWRP
jgi:serine/threonine protein kinase